MAANVVVKDSAGLATSILAGAVNRLMPQLSPHRTNLCWSDIKEVHESPDHALLLAVVDQRIVGMLTVVTYPALGRRKALIEDVVVEEGLRGQGIGEALLTGADRYCKAQGIWKVWLTSRQERGTHGFYTRNGFEVRETIVFEKKY